MSIFTKKGLLLSNNLSDIDNKEAAVNHMLATFAGGNSDALSLKDLEPLIGISATGFDAEQAYKRITNTPSFQDLGDGSAFNNQTFKNQIDDIESFVGRTSYQGGNGLTGRFYRLIDLPSTLKTQITGEAPEIDGSPVDPSDLFNSDQSPNDISFDELKASTPVFQSDEMWLDGDIDFPQTSSFLEDRADVRVALFTGYFRAGNNHAAAQGEETIDGIMFNDLDYSQISNQDVFTNVVVRILIQDAETDETLLNATYDPNHTDVGGDDGSPIESGPRAVTRLIHTGGKVRSGSGNTATKMLKKYQLCKISIAFVLTSEVLTNQASVTKRVRMKFVSCSSNGVFKEKIPMNRTYFYNDSFPIDDSPYATSQDGQVKIAEKTSLKKYGSLLNLYHSEPGGDSPPIVDPIEKDISQQIGTAESFNNLIVNAKLDMMYEPPSGGWDSIHKVSFGPAQFEFTSGNDFIRVNANSIGQDDFKEKIEKGNLVDGLLSLATEDGKKSAIYVVGLSHRKRVIYLSEPATLDAENVTDSPNGGINIIEHRGLMGVGRLGQGTNIQFAHNSSIHGQRNLKAGDFIYVKNNSIPGVTFVDSAPHYLRVKYLGTPLTLEEIQSDGTRSTYTTMDADPAAARVFYYAPNALDNQVLDSFCVLDSDGTHQAPLIKLVVDTEVATGSVITVKKEGITYQGTKVDLTVQNSPTEDDDDVVGRNIVFDGNGVQSVIVANTTIESVTNITSTTADITLSNALGGRLPEGANLIVAKSNDTADKKVSCFPPTDPSAPFKSDGDNIVSTVPEIGRDTVDFTTGDLGGEVKLSFSGLKLINDDSPDDTILPIDISQTNARYTHRFAIRSDENTPQGTKEIEYFIPLTTRAN